MAENFQIAQLVATIPDFMKALVDETMRKRLRLSLLQQRGKIMVNQSGRRRCEYPIRVDKPPTRGYAPRMDIGGGYGDHQSLRKISLPWRGMIVQDAITLWDYKINDNGPGTVVNLFQEKMSNLKSAIQEDFHGVSITAGDGLLPDGIETYLGYTPCASTDKIAVPNDSYGDSEASLSTVLGALGGTWDPAVGTPPNAALGNDYPNGKGSRPYNANSPLFVNTNTTAWGTGQTSFEANCFRVLTQAISWQNKNGGAEGKATNGMMGEDHWTALKYNQEAKFRIQQSGTAKEAIDLGFPDTIMFDGVMLHTEFDAPTGVTYLENMDQIEISSLWPELFWFFDPTTRAAAFDSSNLDMNTLSLKQLGAMWGQFRYRPRHTTKIADLTS